MAARTPLRQKTVPQANVAARPSTNRKPVDPALVFGKGVKRKATADVVDLCTTSEKPGAKHSSPAVKRARLEPAPAVPALERGKKSKARKEKDEALRGDVSANREQWQRKYRHAFRHFVFYFDGIDGAKRQEMASILEELGSRVDDFFSKSVTHVITARPIPANKDAMLVDIDAEKENVATPMPAPPPPKPTLFANKRRSPIKAPLPVQQPAEDVVSKAASLGIKTWDLKKFNKVVNELLDPNSPTKAAPPKPLSLPKLLRDEQLTGITRERDPEVLRPDYNYFGVKSAYVLVEDSTNMHRPIIAKEYARPRRPEESEWPILWGGSEGRTAFSRPHSYMIPPPPLPPLPLIARGKDHLLTNLRKSVSLNQLHKRHAVDAMALAPAAAIDSQVRHDEASGFLMASGNSVSLTSNLQSVTSGAPLQQIGFTGHGAVDKRLALLDKRQLFTQGKPNSSGLLAAIGVRGPGALLKRSMSIDSGLHARNPTAREKPAKPGYCENCRVRYDDFKLHVETGRHRKFARNADNWISLDDCLRRIERPLRLDLLSYIADDVDLRGDLRLKLQLDKPKMDGEDVKMLSDEDESDDGCDDESSEEGEGCEDDDEEEEDDEDDEETIAEA